MRITWDPEKARINLTKHGVAFAEARALLGGSADYLVIYDAAHSEDEDRFFAIGASLRGVITVVYTERADDTLRVISARRATRREQVLFRRQMEGRRR